MKKRLRKKLGRGEFRTWGATLTLRFSEALETHRNEIFMERIHAVYDLAEAFDLTYFGGHGASPEMVSYIGAVRPRADVERDLAQVAAAARERIAGVSAAELGPVHDFQMGRRGGLR